MSETLIQEVDLGLIKGEKGDKGEQGEIGPQGPQGIQGEKGSKGDKGDRGDKGCKGEKGDKGDRGCKGEKGDKGDRGCKGEKGDKGDPGIIGPQGQQGKRGLKGDKGDRGECGAIGPQGEKGDTGTLNWCDIIGKPDIPETIPPAEHDHNHLYYTKVQVNELLNKKLDIVGGAITGNLAVHGVLVGNNNITAYSDKKLKSNIKKIKSPLEKLKLLNGYSYTKNNKKEIGVLAQEVEKIFPMLVHKDNNGIKMVDYGLLVAFLIECVKSQQDQINYLKQKVR